LARSCSTNWATRAYHLSD